MPAPRSSGRDYCDNHTCPKQGCNNQKASTAEACGKGNCIGSTPPIEKATNPNADDSANENEDDAEFSGFGDIAPGDDNEDGARSDGSGEANAEEAGGDDAETERRSSTTSLVIPGKKKKKKKKKK